MVDENNILHGTTTLGLVCRDGIVIAADKRATAGHLIVNKNAEKVHQIHKNMAVTLAGTVSDAQLLVKLIKAELALKGIRSGRDPTVKEAGNLLAGLVYSNIRKMSMIPGVSHFLLGGKDTDGFHLYDIFADGSLTEEDKYVSSGSGCVFALGVLETLYNESITVDEGVELAIKSVNAALQRDSASGNGIRVVTITKEGVEKVLDQDIDTGIKSK